MNKTVVLTVVNQKGGTGKTVTCENLGIGLANEGKRVLLIDNDPQGSLTISLGYPRPDEITVTLSDILAKVIQEQEIAEDEGIIKHEEGIDLIPANIELSGLEVSLVNVMNREKILKQYVDSVKDKYDFILIDCGPSLGMLTINALAAADRLIIPVQAQYLPAKGLEFLLQTVNKVRKYINPSLKIEGVLLTMVDSRTNYAKDISNLIRTVYGGKLHVYKTDIPQSVRASEISAEGKSIYEHDPRGKVADAYRPAVELSFLSPEQQNDVIEAMDYAQCTPSLSQAQRIKKLSQSDEYSLEKVEEIMNEEKKSELDHVTIKNEVLKKYFPKSYTPKQMEDTIVKLLEQWQKQKQKKREMSL